MRSGPSVPERRALGSYDGKYFTPHAVKMQYFHENFLNFFVFVDIIHKEARSVDTQARMDRSEGESPGGLCRRV